MAAAVSPSEATKMTLRSRLAFSPSPRPLSARNLYTDDTPPRARRHQQRRDEKRVRGGGESREIAHTPFPLEKEKVTADVSREETAALLPAVVRRRAFAEKNIQSSPTTYALQPPREEAQGQKISSDGPAQDVRSAPLTESTVEDAIAVPVPVRVRTVKPAATTAMSKSKAAPAKKASASASKALVAPVGKPVAAPKRPATARKKVIEQTNEAQKPNPPAKRSETVSAKVRAQQSVASKDAASTHDGIAVSKSTSHVERHVYEPRVPAKDDIQSSKGASGARGPSEEKEASVSVATLPVEAMHTTHKPPSSIPPSSPNRFFAQQQQAEAQEGNRQAMSTFHFVDDDVDLEYIDPGQYSSHHERKMSLGMGGHIPAGRLGANKPLENRGVAVPVYPAHSTPRPRLDVDMINARKDASFHTGEKVEERDNMSGSEDEPVQLSANKQTRPEKKAKQGKGQHQPTALTSAKATRRETTNAPVHRPESPTPACDENDPFGFVSVGTKVTAMLKMAQQKEMKKSAPESQTQADGQFTPPHNASPIEAALDPVHSDKVDVIDHHTSSELSDFESDDVDVTACNGKAKKRRQQKKRQTPATKGEDILPEAELKPISIDEVCAAFSMTSGALPAVEKGKRGAKAISKAGRGRGAALSAGRKLDMQESGEQSARVPKPKGKNTLQLTPSEVLLPSKRKTTVVTDSNEDVIDDEYDVPPGMTSDEVTQSRGHQQSGGSARGRGEGRGRGGRGRGRGGKETASSRAVTKAVPAAPPAVMPSAMPLATKSRPRPRPLTSEAAAARQRSDSDWDMLPQATRSTSKKKNTGASQKKQSLVDSQPPIKAGTKSGHGQKRRRVEITIEDDDDDDDIDDGEDEASTSKLKATKKYFDTLKDYQLAVEAAPA